VNVGQEFLYDRTVEGSPREGTIVIMLRHDGNNGDFDLALLDVENRVSGFALREDNLILLIF